MLPKAFSDIVSSVHVPEKEREVLGNYVDKKYGDQDMVEYFSLLLLERMRSEPSQRLREQVQEIEMRLVERNLFTTFGRRSVKTDFVEMMSLAFVAEEIRDNTEVENTISGRTAFLKMRDSLKGKVTDDSLSMCRTFVENWDWGGEIYLD